MKKILSLILVIVMLCSSFAGLQITSAADLPSSGSCGTNVTYTFDSTTGELVISGSGKMYDFYHYANLGDSNPFANQSAIKTIFIHSGVTSIGYDAFEGCSSLTSITISYSVKSIGDGAFKGCSGLTSITIPNSVISIGGSAFWSCSGLTGVTIPDSVTIIGDNAFRDCSGLTSVTIGNSVTSIDNYTFKGCSGLTNVTIPNSVTSIGSYAFYDCSGLTSVTIPNSVTSIGSYAFSGCSSLTSITIPNSVTGISGGAFKGCSGLTSIQVASGNTTYDSRNNCNAIIATSNNTLIVGCQSTEIPDSVTSIDYNAFEGCSSLTSITIPDSVKSIGMYAFRDCSGLRSVTIPNSITSIVGSVFYGCSSLTSITIPNSVTIIGDNAFGKCLHLRTISLPQSVSRLGRGAFWSCGRLESITINNSACEISEQSIPYRTEIIAEEDSTAFEYAMNNNMKFTPLGSEGEHQWNEGIITKQANCSQEGEIIFTCIDCGETKKEIIPKTGHQYQKNTVAATCISQGFTVYTCSGCGDSFRAEYIPAIDLHDYKVAVTKPATCTQTGIKTYTCTVCGDKYTESIAMLEHTVVTDEAVAPTCTKYGLSEGKYCSDCGKVFELQEKLEPLGHDFGTEITPATLTENGVIMHPCSRCDKAAASEVIAMPKTFALAKTSYVYTGKAITPAVTVKDAGGKVLKAGTDYSVAYSANTAVGTAKAVITFTGKYSGIKTLTFTILPKGTNLSLAAAKKAFTVKWTKVSGVTGYQVQYALKSNFSGAKTVTIKGTSKASQAVKSLKAGTKYYVRIRTYKTVSGKNYFSAWSAAKAVTTKK